jgi:uncharacterized cupredoxin-like copper-binding protein
MKLQVRRFAGTVGLLVLTGIVIAGCGDSNDNSPATTAGGATGGKSLEIKMDDFFFQPKNATATAGATVIEAANVGAAEHELVLFKTNMDPAKLPTEANGGVNEEKLEQIAEEGGEIPDVEAGETESGDFELTPGKYVMFCNLPGHYAQGMYGTLTVTK